MTTHGHGGPIAPADAPSAAVEYAQRGWASAPVAPGGKGSRTPGWQRRTPAGVVAAEYAGGGVALVLGAPSAGLVDVDLDSPEALALADEILPATTMVHGRASAPRSHRWYIIGGAIPATTAYVDPAITGGERAMLVELRSTGAQTDAPPTVHPSSSERREWHSWPPAPAVVDAPLLELTVRILAGASLVARYWPPPGRRHHASLALAGALLGGSWSEDEAEDLVRAIAEAAGDEESEARVANVATTAQRIAAGEPATGLPTLAEILRESTIAHGVTADAGQRVIDRVVQWLDLHHQAPVDDGAHVAGPTTKKEAEWRRVLTVATTAMSAAHPPGGRPYGLHRTTDGEGWARVPVDGHVECLPVRSRAMQTWLARTHRAAKGQAPSMQALKEALGHIEGEAICSPRVEDLHLRLGGDENRIVLDLGDDHWRAIEVTAAGWHLAAHPALAFRHGKGHQPLPDPQRNAPPIRDALRSLHPALQAHDQRLALVAAWLVGAFRPWGAYTALSLVGEAGSGKSTLGRALLSVTDPTAAGLRAPPRNPRDLPAAFRHAHVLALDNLAGVPEWLSDSLCRVATGASLAGRMLFTDDDEHIVCARRPVLLTSIADVVTAGDLRDRTLVVRVPQIDEAARVTDQAATVHLAAWRPWMLGAILDAVVCGLRRRQQVPVVPGHRMADHLAWAVACTPAMGIDERVMIDAHLDDRRAGAEENLDDSAIGKAVVAMMTGTQEWTGTWAELLAKLDGIVKEGERPKDWPGSPRKLSGDLRRLAPDLRRAHGLDVEQLGREAKRRPVCIRRAG